MKEYERAPRRAWITSALIAVNILCFLYLEIAGSSEDVRFMLEHGAMYTPLILENQEYYRLIRNVKKVYPISREINQAIIETYEYLQTLPNEKARQKHIKRVEKGLKDQYTPRMKKLSFAQGKLLIKLIDRQSNSTSYELVKAFMGPFKAGFYQTFAALFGASLKKEYDPQGEDKLTERVVLMVENGQI